MTKATEAIDVEVLDGDIEGTPAKKGGVIRSLFRLVTLPFRLAAALVRGVFKVLGLSVATILLPIRAAIALTKRIVGLASDLVFAVWRLVLFVVGLILGLFKLVFSILNATIGAAIRLVIGVITRSFKLVIGTFLFATGIGRKRRKAKKVKEKAKSKAKKAKDKTLDLAA